MPIKYKSNGRAYRQKRTEMIAQLGGKCISCGSTVDLEFDHIDRKTKIFTITMGWFRKNLNLPNELKKCQLLCHPCHVGKTRGELNIEHRHGTLGRYHSPKYSCRCDACKKAWDKYKNERRKRYASSARP